MNVKQGKKEIQTKATREALPRRMSKDVLKAHQRREEVYEAVAKVMLKRRSGIITLEQVASQLRGSRGIIYYYFKSRADMLYQMMSYILDLTDSIISPILNDYSVPPLERLENYVRARMVMACGKWELHRALWDGLHVRELPPQFQRPLLYRMNKTVHDFAELIVEVTRDQHLEGLDARVAARHIFSLCNITSMWYDANGRLTPEEMAETVIQLAFNGILHQATTKER